MLRNTCLAWSKNARPVSPMVKASYKVHVWTAISMSGKSVSPFYLIISRNPQQPPLQQCWWWKDGSQNGFYKTIILNTLLVMYKMISKLKFWSHPSLAIIQSWSLNPIMGYGAHSLSRKSIVFRVFLAINHLWRSPSIYCIDRYLYN